MAFDYKPDYDGLAYIDDTVVDGYQPMSVLLHEKLAHNQELINDTFQTKHLANDWHKRQITYNYLGYIAAAYGPYPNMPNIECTVRLYTDQLAGDAIVLANDTLLKGTWKFIDDNDDEQYAYPDYVNASGDQMDTATVTGQWQTFTVVPPRDSLIYYIHIIFIDNTYTYDVVADIYSTSIIQRRRIFKSL